ncbi:hypothetical protein GE061_015826 [Apolygus lucorum]|uniref:Uncharacterized protein n=1 Tax=Apolygus lucorum TaxID=248454 RepID=A0A8S9XM27_APOLU|nr:hypothetical protein GE061_015826 [Apolygus lucorum]
MHVRLTMQLPKQLWTSIQKALKIMPPPTENEIVNAPEHTGKEKRRRSYKILLNKQFHANFMFSSLFQGAPSPVSWYPHRAWGTMKQNFFFKWLQKLTDVFYLINDTRNI